MVAIIAAVVCFFIYTKSNSDNAAATEQVVVKEMPEAEEIPVETEEPAQAELPAPAPSAAPGVLHDGYNAFAGTFNYKGAKYGFTVTFNYDAATGSAYGATYEADGYGGVSRLTSVSVSPDGTGITLRGGASGSGTDIRVSAAPGSSRYSGSMTRGTHVGTCTMTLQ